MVVGDVSEAVPQLETDESYDLSVGEGGGVAVLKAATVYGALRGIETLSQMIYYDFDEVGSGDGSSSSSSSSSGHDGEG